MLHNENSRVKIPALVHFTRLGYEYLSLKNYTGKDLIDEDTNIFIDLLCDAINRINGIEYTIGKYELSEKIRTNKELASFIISVRNLNRKPHIPMKYDNVSLAYANSIDEAKNIIEYYRNKGYTFINYSKSNYNYSPYIQYEEDFDTHHVIGQEFDNVLMLMDKSFYYDTNNILQGIPHPNPDYLYPNLFYQGITRVREKIALVVVDAPELFEKISSIVD